MCLPPPLFSLTPTRSRHSASRGQFPFKYRRPENKANRLFTLPVDFLAFFPPSYRLELPSGKISLRAGVSLVSLVAWILMSLDSHCAPKYNLTGRRIGAASSFVPWALCKWSATPWLVLPLRSPQWPSAEALCFWDTAAAPWPGHWHYLSLGLMFLAVGLWLYQHPTLHGVSCVCGVMSLFTKLGKKCSASIYSNILLSLPFLLRFHVDWVGFFLPQATNALLHFLFSIFPLCFTWDNLYWPSSTSLILTPSVSDLI